MLEHVFIDSCRPTLLRMSHGNKRLLTYLYAGFILGLKKGVVLPLAIVKKG